MIWALALAASLLTLPAWAGGTGTTELLPVQGAGASRFQGDYVTDGAGIGSYYSFYIEVPPAATRLVVDIFDADIGIGGTTEEAANRDELRGGGTTATYSLRNPLGTVQPVAFSLGTSSGPTGADNNWLTLLDTNSASAPAFVAVETDVEPTDVNSLDLVVPSECATGDFLIAVVATHDVEHTVTPPFAWTAVNEGSAGPNDTARLDVFRKFAVGTDIGSTATFSWNFTGEEAAGGILCYRGVDSTSPINAVAAATGNSSSPTAPSVTTTVTNTRILRMYAADDDDLGSSPYPSGHTGRFNIESSTGSGTVSAGFADTTQAAAAATGTAAFALSATEQWRALTVAIQGVDVELVAGHWELRVDQSGSSGDDINAIGIRAHDGNSGSGGVELNIYARSYMTYGTNNAGGTSGSRSYTHYPYVVSGCDLEAYNFDWDSNQGNQGTIDFDTRAGTSLTGVPSTSMSANDVWTSPTVTGWADQDDATEYGIWTMDAVISGWPGNGNYGQILLSDENGIGGGDPNAQPEANSFDIYVATDAGATPVKPYLEQQVRYLSGPQTPNTGDTTRMTITVRFVNPTAHDVTFSNSNLVTANVPGGTVLYAGGDQVTQGTVTSEPSIGGSGNITWNPGTVSAGDTVLLSYNVDVTPTSNGQVIDVTGTPSANGTTAVYVDETCTGASPACSGAQLTQATPTLGPLCQLQVEEDALTYVKIDRFDSFLDRGGLVVEWQSSSEAGTMHYELWRADGENWTPVKSGRVPSLFGAPQGGVYRVLDPDGRRGDSYAIVEFDRRGESSTHGPFIAHAEEPLDPPMVEMVTSEARTPSAGDQRLAVAGDASSGAIDAPQRPRRTWTPNRGGDGGGRLPAPEATDIFVRETGLYYLSAPNIAGALGLATPSVQQRISNGTLRLENAGQPVAWTAAAGDQGLYFYGQAIDSLFTLDNVYRLSLGAGPTMTSSGVSSASPQPGNDYVAHDVHEVDAFAGLVLGLDPASDYWYWAVLTAGNSAFDTWNATVPASALGNGSGELKLHLLGSDLDGPGGDHEVDLYLGGSYLTTATWSGAEHSIVVPIDTADLAAGDNTITARALLPAGTSSSFVFIDSAELTYQRQYEAIGDELRFGVDGNGTITLSGFSSQPMLFEISDPELPILITGAGTSFQPAGGHATFFAAGPAAVREPLAMRPVGRRDLLATPAEMIFLVPADIEHSVDELMGYRQNQGMSVLRVTLDEVMDQFNHGIFDPNAIREFLRAAEVEWGVAPSYLALVGTGNYDYRNLSGNGGQLMPPLMLATASGLFAADDLYGDLDDDGFAEVAVGRIPAADYSQVWQYSQKVIAYESAEASSDVLMVSGDQRPGEAIDFGQENGILADEFLGVANRTQLDLDKLGVDTLRAELFAQLARGPALVNYFGHGGSTAWAHDQILTLDDLPGLTGPPTVFTGLTCLMNRFELAGFESLGAGLLFAPGGAVAVWSPTAPETHALSRGVGQTLYQRLGEWDWSGSGPVFGDLVREVKATSGGSPEGLATFVLLGDPALELRLDALPGPPPPPPGGEVE